MFKWIFSQLRSSMPFFLGALVAILLATGALYLPPILIQSGLDHIFGEEGFWKLPETLLNWVQDQGVLGVLLIMGSLVVISTAVGGIFSFGQGYFSAQASEKLAQQLRGDLYAYISKLTFLELQKANTGDWIQRVTSDLDNIRRFLTLQLPELFRTLVLLFSAPFVLGAMDGPLTLASIGVYPVILAFSWIFFHLIQKSFDRSEKAESKFTQILQENLEAPGVIKAFGSQSREYQRFGDANTHYQEVTEDLIRRFATFWSINDLLSLAQVGIILGFGGFRVLQGDMSTGTLISFLILSNLVLWPVRQLGRTLGDLSKASVSLTRLWEIRSLPLEDHLGSRLKPKLTGDLEMKNVSLKLGQNDTVLRNISFSLKEGQSLAILGKTGSGKTSLVNLIAGLTPFDGQVMVGGYDIRDLDLKHLRKNLGFVLQSPYIYGRTIEENITMRDPLAPDHLVSSVVHQAHFHPVLSDLEDGLQTMLGEYGVNLSGGQRQRLALARAFLGDPGILILDDSTSALDVRTERLIQETLKQRTTTTVLVTHRVSTAKVCDLVMYLEEGEIVQFGSPDNLLDKEGPFRKLSKDQLLPEDVA